MSRAIESTAVIDDRCGAHCSLADNQLGWRDDATARGPESNPSAGHWACRRSFRRMDEHTLDVGCLSDAQRALCRTVSWEYWLPWSDCIGGRIVWIANRGSKYSEGL